MLEAVLEAPVILYLDYPALQPFLEVISWSLHYHKDIR
jgi:hypothetical protein